MTPNASASAAARVIIPPRADGCKPWLDRLKPGRIEVVGSTCLFCEAFGSGVLTNEHVNPMWPLKYPELPDGDGLFQGVASSTTGTLAQPPRVHSTFNFVQGHVCTVCNSGWMSRLEIAAKPILISLIDHSRNVESLSPNEAAIVAKWTVKTAYLHSWTSPLKQPVQIDHLKMLHGDSGMPASGVGVFATQGEYRKPTAYVQTGHWPQLALPPNKPTIQTPADSYKLGLQFRHVSFLVAFWPGSGSVLTPVRNMHRRIYPVDGQEDPDYSPSLVAGTGPVDQLLLFANWLAVWHLGASV